MKLQKNMKLSATAVAVMAVIALGGCSGESAIAPAPTAAKPGVVSGVITGFGSVFIDGVEYETNTAAVSMDGTAAADDSGLKLGMFITLEGSVNPDGTTGVANSIKFADDVEGIVQSKTLNADGSVTLVVMGQTVTIDANTVFESSVTGQVSAVDVGVGNIVEVSGYSSGDGTVYASRVEVKKEARGSEELELKGNIFAVDTTANTFTIGGMTIDFSTATLEGVTLDASAVGKYVEVKSTQGLNGSGQLIASKVEVENGGKKGEDLAAHKNSEDGDEKEFKLEGVITTALANGKFGLNGEMVTVDEETEIEHGATGDLIAGAKVRVEVKLDSNNNLIAQEIKLPEGKTNEVMYMGYVESVDTVNKQFTVMGLPIVVTNFTRLNDEDDADGSVERYFNVDKLVVNDLVKVKAYTNDVGKLVAAKLERKTNEQKPVEVKAKVEAVNNDGSLTIGGVKVNITAVTSLSNVVVGDKLKVKGTYASGVLTAIEGESESGGEKVELDD